MERPALDVPLPPPRVITPVPVAPGTPAVEPVGDLPGNATPPPPRPRAPRDNSKPEQKPEDPKPVEPPPVPPTTPPVPQLRIPEAGDSAQVAAQIREIIDRTRRLLKGVTFASLSDPLKKAYQDANLFATQAEEALKASNVVFAKELADKAERLAKELQGRQSAGLRPQPVPAEAAAHQ